MLRITTPERGSGNGTGLFIAALIRCGALALTIVTVAACTTEVHQSTGSDGQGGASVPAGNAASDFVAAGNRSSDGTHAAVSSLGQSPGVNGVTRSTHYKLVGGLVAATQP